MILLDNNNITGGAAHVCGPDGPAGPSVMSADCCKEGNDDCTATAELECECCTLCCADKASSCYNDQDLLSNLDLEWEHTFSVNTGYIRDSFVFSENIIFEVKRGE